MHSPKRCSALRPSCAYSTESESWSHCAYDSIPNRTVHSIVSDTGKESCSPLPHCLPETAWQRHIPIVVKEVRHQRDQEDEGEPHPIKANERGETTGEHKAAQGSPIQGVKKGGRSSKRIRRTTCVKSSHTKGESRQVDRGTSRSNEQTS